MKATDVTPGVWQYVNVILPLLLSLLPVFLFLPFLNEPLDADAGVYATIGRGILRGQIPYHDLFDHKQPLLYGWYALSFLLFGEDSTSPRILILFHLAATSILVYWCGRLLWDSQRLGYLGGLAFGLTPGLACVTAFGDARFLALTPTVAAFFAFLLACRSGKVRWYLASGVLSGLAITTLVVTLFNFLALVVFVLWRGLARRMSYRREAASLVAGAATVGALVTLPFAMTGTLGDLLYANLIYNLEYLEGPHLTPSSVAGLFGLAFLLAGPFSVGAALGAWRLLRRNPREKGALLGLWTLASLVGFFVTGKLSGHYLVGMFPALALLTAVSLDELRAAWHIPWLRASAVVTLFLVLLAVFVNLGPYVHWVGGGQMLERYPKREAQQMELLPEIADEVADNTSPNDLVLYLGSQPGPFYFYADRPPASRSILPCVFVDAKLSREVLAALERTRPLYVVDAFYPEAGCSEQTIRPALDRLLGLYYEYEGKLHFADIYKLRQHSSNALTSTGYEPRP